MYHIHTYIHVYLYVYTYVICYKYPNGAGDIVKKMKQIERKKKLKMISILEPADMDFETTMLKKTTAIML